MLIMLVIFFSDSFNSLGFINCKKIKIYRNLIWLFKKGLFLLKKNIEWLMKYWYELYCIYLIICKGKLNREKIFFYRNLSIGIIFCL